MGLTVDETGVVRTTRDDDLVEDEDEVEDEEEDPEVLEVELIEVELTDEGVSVVAVLEPAVPDGASLS